MIRLRIYQLANLKAQLNPGNNEIAYYNFLFVARNSGDEQAKQRQFVAAAQDAVMSDFGLARRLTARLFKTYVD